ncbi:hypothetical protein RJ640_006529 [Escallonia rubra]|uniref:Transmembrane protein 45A n=1 Tax=Escallonia rubra TaxID=112253 RepID=A0AA88QSZ6_9ASTE|nr:hypothetical protein RJ640_006529 [Escallonia rubra]
MGSFLGHAAPGFGFLFIGLWHLFNHIRLHALHPNSYTSLPWFPSSKIRYLELFLIMGGCSISVSTELFIGHLLDNDGTIPSTHLRRFEHSSISMSLFIYSSFAIIIDQIGPKAQYGLTQLLGAIAFAQQLLLFHLHSNYHMGVEAQYHMLLQIALFVTLITTFMIIGYPKSFLVSFIRSLSILFQGLWLIVMGLMIWTPALLPKGCFKKLEKDRHVIRCHGDEVLERAKSIVNIQFSWYLMGVTIFAVSLYLALIKIYPEKVEYESLYQIEGREEEPEDVKAQRVATKAKTLRVKDFSS